MPESVGGATLSGATTACEQQHCTAGTLGRGNEVARLLPAK
ncbi:MAG TPA: hypothetical protein VHY91_01635 [Pirellulales bacterium]|nr:hypothetical protein [Pirellulales bacterium]